MRKLFYFASAFLLCLTVSRVEAVLPYTITADSVLLHISRLADDSLEGREVGEPGEWKAGEYIAHVFRSAGLLPKGDDRQYLQEFEFVKRIDFGDKNRLIVNGQELILDEEFQPLKQSASMEFSFDAIIDVDYGITFDSADGNYDDYAGKDVAGKAVLVKRLAPSAEDNPHMDFDKYSSMTDKIKTAMDHNAAAVIFYTPEDQDDTLAGSGAVNLQPKGIPIIFLRRKGIEKLGLGSTHPVITNLSGQTELIKTRDTSYNVVGFIPSGNDTTVIIGAHYDHLGWGGPSSLYTGKEKMIHNGADDNASGVAALLELARHYSSQVENLKYAMLFIAFAGEEHGLLGSNHFAKNMTIDSSKVRMMVNMDMIGRLKDQEDGLAVLGTGTCSEFKTFFDSLNYSEIKLAFNESGIGPSDHTSFYNRHIPVLHFFTGAHSDYHKPSDDVDKIDSPGIAKVTQLVTTIVDHFDNYPGQLTFQKTKDAGEGKRRAQYSVTLGIMPDYVAEVKGLKIDGVIDDRPGARAGMLEGDIIIRLGEIDINDIYDYMNALGKFRKGDTTAAVIQRGDALVNLTVIFE